MWPQIISGQYPNPILLPVIDLHKPILSYMTCPLHQFFLYILPQNV